MPVDPKSNPLTSTVEESINMAEQYLMSTLPNPPITTSGSGPEQTLVGSSQVDASLLSTDSLGEGIDPKISDTGGISDDSIDGVDVDDNIYYASDINNNDQKNVAWTVNFGGGEGKKPKLGGDRASSRVVGAVDDGQRVGQGKHGNRVVEREVPYPPQPPQRNLSRPAKESLDAVESENTFQPQITSKGRNFQAPSNVHERLVKYGEDKEKVREEMSKDRQKEIAKKRAEEHPFQPKVTKKGSKSRGSDAESTRERLYKLAGERDMIRECTKYHMMEAEARAHR